MHEAAPHPMHIVVAMMDAINDEDDLLDEFDAIFSSIDIESSSSIYESMLYSSSKWRFTLYL